MSVSVPKPLVVAFDTNGTKLLVGAEHPIFGCVSRGGKAYRSDAPRWMKEQYQTWMLIQAERARLGLPFLPSEEMIICRNE